MNQNLSSFVRPKTLDEIVGMEHNKQILHYDINGCLELGQPMPSYIISGIAGGGKTTIAGIIATLAESNIYKYVGTEIKNVEDLLEIADICKDDDVIYLEEAHAMGKNVQTALLEWIESFKLPDGTDAPRISFIMPTTNPGKLSKPLRDRCKHLHVGYYSIAEIEEILVQAAQKVGINLTVDTDALHILAKCSRGTPRIAINNRLDIVRKIMVVDKLPFCLDTVRKMLETHDINEWGLEANDLLYLNTLYDKVSLTKRPVSKMNMSYSTGFDVDMIEEVIERYLLQIDIIKIESRGRMITPFGCEVLSKLNPLVSRRLMTIE